MSLLFTSKPLHAHLLILLSIYLAGALWCERQNKVASQVLMDPLFALAIASDEKGRGNGGGEFWRWDCGPAKQLFYLLVSHLCPDPTYIGTSSSTYKTGCQNKKTSNHFIFLSRGIEIKIRIPPPQVLPSHGQSAHCSRRLGRRSPAKLLIHILFITIGTTSSWIKSRGNRLN